ncbi:carbohydrate ABC transporter permease [Chelativorans xinjiangense]|uniref:carbohydrate ABC transporter permease n=1 Tax=Chelativorans xinjiangense TaxID=2681485 RepID=UPI0013569AF5|nr:ABC transporter permease subunit [Chelativorans xinjiangense]
MIENARSIDRTATVLLLLGSVFVLLPLAFVAITATQSYGDFLRNNFSLLPGTHFWDNVAAVWSLTDLPRQIMNSVIVAALVSGGKCFLAFTTAYAVVFFRTRYVPLVYAAVVASIMLPIELRVITVYQVASNLALPVNAAANTGGLWAVLFGAPLDLQLNALDSYAGIALPLMAQGAGTLILVQFFKTLPRDLARAATMDGAGPLRFMADVLLPLSKGPLLSLFIYFFIGGWVDYMWPLVAASSPEMQTAVVGLARLGPGMEEDIPNYPLEMTGAIMVTVIPLVLIALTQRRIVRGLALSEK